MMQRDRGFGEGRRRPPPKKNCPVGRQPPRFAFPACDLPTCFVAVVLLKSCRNPTVSAGAANSVFNSRRGFGLSRMAGVRSNWRNILILKNPVYA
jgi:hypothetical protein